MESFSWVSCYKKAVGNKNESKVIHFSESDLQKSTLINDNNLKNSQKEEIDQIKIDDFVDKHFINEVHFIKCDVEGYEFEVLRGMKNLLINRNPELSIEITINKNKMSLELDSHWEIVSEAIQTILRKSGQSQAYEQLKELTRGETVNRKVLADYILKLNIPEKDRDTLLSLTPQTYIGLSTKISELL